MTMTPTDAQAGLTASTGLMFYLMVLLRAVCSGLLALYVCPAWVHQGHSTALIVHCRLASAIWSCGQRPRSAMRTEDCGRALPWAPLSWDLPCSLAYERSCTVCLSPLPPCWVVMAPDSPELCHQAPQHLCRFSPGSVPGNLYLQTLGLRPPSPRQRWRRLPRSCPMARPGGVQAGLLSCCAMRLTMSPWTMGARSNSGCLLPFLPAPQRLVQSGSAASLRQLCFGHPNTQKGTRR